ncbi:hypothetical protein CLV80_10592 [Yoonia maritima]|uniref:Uncharacterized protein n=1 Tax=Yoonia maritima TaxID=1435347 RepID=A0A2T0VZ77_9RHOB|nr:hypothetical protein [Yoonia maritima]PRY77609.1 hypothetical protein CLV80_10592 [Yoonia maritima]
MADVPQAQRLSQLTGLMLRSVQSDMAELSQREADLRRNLAQLVQTKRARAAAQSSIVDVAILAGADVRWLHWVDQRRATINTELAQVLAQQEACRAKLKNVFGRDQAVHEIVKRMQSDSRILHQRRAYYVS